MTPERWRRIRALFDEALEHEPGARADFLSEATHDDPSLAAEVLGLLASDEKAGSFLSAPPPSPSLDASLGAPGPSLVGRHLGPYRVLREIGQGGMGTVYCATRDDDQYEKQVAIKLVRGGMDAEFVLQRFRAERQILANLEHPNIARLIDGGTTEEGWPYFAMEYVEGQPIDRHCAVLGVRQTIGLFRTVCAAVQYAHQRLVIHRDLKPGNIFVSAEGVPKLLDFGIAKLLEGDGAGSGEATLSTVGPLMTPEYASPEQMRGEAVTTASDVYSLGMLLYELLARKRAYEIRTRAPEEMARVVCQQQPEKPSAVADRALSRQLAGDLDTIVLKAIRKEPSRRYATVGELSEDLHRHLSGLPVLARRDTLAYRSGKFVGRHKAAVVVAGLLALSLVGGILATARQARIAEANRARAERRFNDVRKLANSFLFEFHDAIATLPGSTPARELVVRKALEYLDGLAQEAADDPSLQRELAAAYVKVGDVQGRPKQANLGNTEGARQSYGKAIRILEAAVAAQPSNAEAGRDLAIALISLATLLDDARGEVEESLRLGERALGILRNLLANSPEDFKRRRNVTFALVKVGDFQERLGRAEAALATFRENLTLAEAQAARTAGTADPRSDYDQRTVRVGQYRLADLASRSGLHTEAEGHARAAYASAQRAVETDRANAMFQRDLAGTAQLVGDTLLRADRSRDALPFFVEAERLLSALAERDPQDATAREDRLSAVTRLADTRAAMGDVRAGLEAYGEILHTFEERLHDDPENVDARANLGSALASMGDLRQRLGDTSGALALLPRALTMFPLPATEGSAQARYERAAALNKLAATEAIASLETRRPKAERERLALDSCERYAESLVLWRGLAGPTPSAHFDVGPPSAQRVATERALERCPHLP